MKIDEEHIFGGTARGVLFVIWTSTGRPLDVQTYFERLLDVQLRCCAQWVRIYLLCLNNDTSSLQLDCK